MRPVPPLPVPRPATSCCMLPPCRSWTALLLLLLLAWVQQHESYLLLRLPKPRYSVLPLRAWEAASTGQHPAVDADGAASALDAVIDTQVARSLRAAARFNATDGAAAAAALRRCAETFRRELRLLRRLAASDDALQELRELWQNDREPYTAPYIVEEGTAAVGVSSLRTTVSLPARRVRSWWRRWWAPMRRRHDDDEDLSFPPVKESERALLRRIRRYPRWADPRLRLAEWYGRRRRSREALAQCVAALELKPWHVAALDLLVRLALQRGDLGLALTWARLRLPSLPSAAEKAYSDRGEGTIASVDQGDSDTSGRDRKRLRRRQAWVERAISQAMEQLDEMEEEREASLMKTGNFIIPSETWS